MSSPETARQKKLLVLNPFRGMGAPKNLTNIRAKRVILQAAEQSKPCGTYIYTEFPQILLIGILLAILFLSQLCPVSNNGSVTLSAVKKFLSASRAFAQNQTENTALSENQTEQIEYSQESLTAEENLAVKLLNEDRKAYGLQPLNIDPQLISYARFFCQDMISRHYFSHWDPEGRSMADRLRQRGISYRCAGENLAIDTSVEAAERALMNSRYHRANILNSNFSKVGIGVFRDDTGAVYLVQEFVGD